MSPTAVIFSAIILIAVSAVGEGNAAAVVDFSAPQKRNNEKTRVLALFPRIGRMRPEEMQKHVWPRMMNTFPRVGRSGNVDYEERTWCSDCSQDYLSDVIRMQGKRANLAAFPRSGRMQLAVFPRMGKRQNRLLGLFPRVGRSNGIRKFEDGGNVRLTSGQEEKFAEYANNNKAWEGLIASDDDESEQPGVKSASIEDV